MRVSSTAAGALSLPFCRMAATDLYERVEQQRPRTRGVDALWPVALDEADNPNGGAEALFGMGP
jgi:hypothetical protein